MFPCQSLSENWGGVDPASGLLHPQEELCAIQWPQSGCGRTSARRAQAHLAFCLLLTGNTIPTKKAPPPSSFGRQFRKFSYEGTTGPQVTPLGYCSSESGAPWAMLLCIR